MKKIMTILLFGMLMTNNVKCSNKPDRILEYKEIENGKNLTLHVFNPPDHKITDKTPAIVFFFGGGWSGGNVAHFYRQSKYLASRGMVAVCVEYRTKKSHKTSPAECVKDAKSAMRWVRSHAKELGVDPNKIAAGGGSAGGHLAAAVAMSKGFNDSGDDKLISCRPNALLLFNPVIDNGSEGYGYKRVKDYWQDFSPIHNINTESPPAIIFLGTKDKYIPVKTGEAYQKKMKDLGLRCELCLYKGQPHGFFNKAKFKETMLESEKFLISLGYLKGEATIKKGGLKRN